MKCALCGFEFSEADAKRPCARCPVGANCDLICCPNCGYQTPGEPRWLRRWRFLPSPRLLSPVRERGVGVRGEDGGRGEGGLGVRALEIIALRSGWDAEIVEVRAHDDAVLRKLTAVGILPGVRVRLLRKFPCYLIELGHAQIALDKELASAILVRPVSER